VRIISIIIFAISSSLTILSIIFKEHVTSLSFFNQLSTSLATHIVGSITFFTTSSYALKNAKVNKQERKGIVILFVVYMLTMSLSTSHLLWLHNARNMLTMYLIGIGTVSLFFAIEWKPLILVASYISLVFFGLMIFPDLKLHERVLNSLAGLVLSTVLITFSRYCYYFKSSHFVKLKELEETNLEILKLNNQKGEILSFVAHDLRMPLNNIEALSKLMLMEDESNTEARMIGNSTDQAKTIINDLIEVAKQESISLATETIELKPFMEKIIAKWKANTERKITLIEDAIGIHIDASPSKLERIIDNLISNAFKFSSIYKPIDISIDKIDGMAQIKVKDYGIGIPEHLKPQIFDQFSKAGREGLQGEKSIGLGLHISHRLAERQHGKLKVESKENEGTTFVISLPLTSA
jgi:signal transduction histidine kinase